MNRNPRSFALVAVLALASPVLVQAQPAPAKAAQQNAPPPPGQNPQQPETKEVAALPSFAKLVESVKAAVVNVDVQARVKGGVGAEEFGGDLFDQFFGGGRGGGRPHDELSRGAGSGFIIDPKGVIITNNHVVEDAVDIEVTLDDGREFNAQLVGRDPLTDVAVIKIKQKVDNLPAVKLGDSDQMKVGDWVLAIGNPFGLASSVSAGIISATARNIHITRYDEFIQTDAAINPGNSGGPLFNMKGEVIGMNTAIVASGSGIGFAVPSSLIRGIIPQLQAGGKVVRGYLGVQIQDLNDNLAQAMGVPDHHGAIVTDVSSNVPAAKVLKPDDVIVAINGQKIDSAHALSRQVAMQKPGSDVTLSVFRGGKQQDLKVEVATRPDLEGVYKEQPKAAQTEGGERQMKIGLGFSDMDPRFAQGTSLPSTGALVREVRPGSPAEHAELRPGMIVTEAAGKPVKTARDLEGALKNAKSGSLVLLRVVAVNDDGTTSRYLRALPVP